MPFFKSRCGQKAKMESYFPDGANSSKSGRMSPGDGQKRDRDSRVREVSVTRSHNFVFDPSSAIGKFGNEIGKSGERIQRIRYFELASYMMKSFACFLVRATFRGA